MRSAMTVRGLVLAAGLLAPAITPTSALAHARLRESQPAEGAGVAGVQDLRLLYTEAVDLQRSTVAAASAASQAVALPALAADPAEPKAVLLHLAQPLPPGAYTVEWHAVAARNGHRTDGTYTFTVAAADAVRIDQPWARATAPQQRVGGAYMTLTSPAADRLVGASSPVAARTEVHEMRMDGNIMRMRELPDGLKLPAGQAVALAPGGYHIMLMDLKQPLVAGQSVPVQLRFEHAPPAEVQVRIAPIGARGPNDAAQAAGGGGMAGHGDGQQQQQHQHQ